MKTSQKNKVYIASPYLRGDKEENVMRQISAFHILKTHGFVPYAPLLGHYIDRHYPMTCKDWLDFDLEWLEVCDIVLRLDGDSNGADAEVARAHELGIPVYFGIGDFLKHCI